MKAIVAKYLAPTTHRGSRIKVFAEGWDAIVEGMDYEMDFDKQAREMAYRLLEEYCPREEGDRRPAYKLVKGTLPDGDLVFCLGQFN